MAAAAVASHQSLQLSPTLTAELMSSFRANHCNQQQTSVPGWHYVEGLKPPRAASYCSRTRDAAS